MTDRTPLALAQREAEEITRLLHLLIKCQEHEHWTWFESIEERLREWPLCVETLTTHRVTLGTGGPAYGVDFGPHGATVWGQDWFTRREHVELDDDLAAVLAGVWYIGGEDGWAT